MPHLSLDDIQTEVNELAKKINAPADLLPTYGKTRDGAHPHIESHEDGSLHYVVVERGEELERKTTQDLDELLSWIFTSVTFSMASAHELQHRIKGRDIRRLMFEKQNTLLTKLDPKWRKKESDRQKQILREHPYDDLAGLRATFCAQLRSRGLPEDEIMRRAYEKYPGLDSED